MLASRVVWTDGRDHPMNTPRAKPGASAAELRRPPGGGLRADPVRLVRVGHVRRGPGPRAGAAGRRLLLVERRLRVLHPADPRRGRALRARTASWCTRPRSFGSTDADPGERFFYEVRNKVWMFTRSPGLSPGREGSRTAARPRDAGPAPSPAPSDRRTLARGLGRGLVTGLPSGPGPTGSCCRGRLVPARRASATSARAPGAAAVLPAPRGVRRRRPAPSCATRSPRACRSRPAARRRSCWSRTARSPTSWPPPSPELVATARCAVDHVVIEENLGLGPALDRGPGRLRPRDRRPDGRRRRQPALPVRAAGPASSRPARTSSAAALLEFGASVDESSAVVPLRPTRTRSAA